MSGRLQMSQPSASFPAQQRPDLSPHAMHAQPGRAHIPPINTSVAHRQSSRHQQHLQRPPIANSKSGGTGSQTNISLAQSLSAQSPPSQVPSPSTPQPSKSLSPIARQGFQSQRRDLMLLLALILASTCFAATAWFAQATFSNRMTSNTRDLFKNVFKVDIRDTLTILALLSGVLALITGFVLDGVLDVVQWSLICQDDGVSILSILAVSPTTGLLGTLGLVFAGSAFSGTRIWALVKISLRISLWVSGVILFINTSLETVYRPQFSYAATAGVGPFDGSYVGPYLESLRAKNLNLTEDVLPYTTLALAHNLIVNSQHAISTDHKDCDDDSCDSYLLPGGLETSIPRPPTNFTNDPVILVENVPGTQIDFRRDNQEERMLNDEDCDLFYEHPYIIAIRLCVRSSSATPGSFFASMYICDRGTVGDTCLTNSTTAPSINTTFSIYATTASLVVSRSNSSILSISDSSKPIPDYSLDVSSYRSALRWLLNYTAAGIPGPSSAVEYFWSAPTQVSSKYWSAGPWQAFESLLAYPLWFFNVNNAGNPYNIGDFELPREYHTTASVASPFTKIVVNRVMLIIFVVLQSVILLFSWTVVLKTWATDTRLPKISAYPLVDFAFKTRDATPASPATRTTKDIFGAVGAAHAGDAVIRFAVQNQKVGFKDSIAPALPFGQWLRGLFSRK